MRLFVALWSSFAGAALLLPLLPEDLLRTYAWAFWHLRTVPLSVRAAFLALGAAPLFPEANKRIWWSMLWIFRRLRRWHYMPVYPFLAAVFWTFRQRNYALGDSARLIQMVTFFSHVTGFHITYDEPR